MERFSAEFLDGQSAAVRPVTIAVDLGGLRISDAASDAPVDLWAFAGLEVEMLQGGVLHLEHPGAPGALITSRDPGLESALRHALVHVEAQPRGRRLLRELAFYGIALAVAVTAVHASLQPLSRALARRVPLDVEERLGLQIEGLLEKSFCRSEAATAALDGLTVRLGRSDLDGPAARGVTIINWEAVNAFTFPGGKVVLTSGLIDEAEGADEIAGVLAHELEHVRQRHVMARIIRGSILSLGWAVTVGDFSGLFVLDPSTIFAVASQSFSRDDERSADRGALARLDGARISRQGFAAFFRRIQKETDVLPAWLSTHPASEERFAAIAVDGPLVPRSPALSNDEWKALKNACAGQSPGENADLGLGDE